MGIATLSCPHCGKHLQIDEAFSGQEVSCPACSEVFLVPPVAAVVAPDAAVAQSRSVTYAGFWKRFAALLIDSVLLSIGGLIVGVAFGAVLGGVMAVAGYDLPTTQAACGVSGYILGTILNWLYYTLFESSSKQATLGKMALGIQVTDLEGRRVSFARANGRYWAKFVSSLTLCIGFLMAAFTERKQALHDVMAGCLVVNR